MKDVWGNPLFEYIVTDGAGEYRTPYGPTGAWKRVRNVAKWEMI